MIFIYIYKIYLYYKKYNPSLGYAEDNFQFYLQSNVMLTLWSYARMWKQDLYVVKEKAEDIIREHIKIKWTSFRVFKLLERYHFHGNFVFKSLFIGLLAENLSKIRKNYIRRNKIIYILQRASFKMYWDHSIIELCYELEKFKDLNYKSKLIVIDFQDIER